MGGRTKHLFLAVFAAGLLAVSASPAAAQQRAAAAGPERTAVRGPERSAAERSARPARRGGSAMRPLTGRYGRGGQRLLGLRGARPERLPTARATDERRGTANLTETRERLGQIRTQLRDAHIGPGKVDRVLQFVGLGMPSPANRTNPEDLLLARNEYVVSYNRSRKTPNWAAWHVTAADIGDAPRSEKFHSDPTLPRDWKVATPGDYKRSGYTRGHLVASGERTSSTQTNKKTFFLSNIVPQTYENNAGPWQDFEVYYRDLAASGKKDIYLFAGGVYDGPRKFIGRNRVEVPSATWKVAVIVEPGTPIDQINENARVVSIVVPNRPGEVKLNQTFEQFRVKPTDIERMTGLKFFTNLPETVRARLVDKLDTETIPVHYFKGFKMAEIKKLGLKVPDNVQRDPGESRPNVSAPEPDDWRRNNKIRTLRNRTRSRGRNRQNRPRSSSGGQGSPRVSPAALAPWNRQRASGGQR